MVTVAPLEQALAEHSPERDRPLGAYATLIGVFIGMIAGFAAWFRRSGRELPDRMSASDLALITIATHKVSREITKSRVGSGLRAPFTRFQYDSGPGEVAEAAQGRGLRRAIGELLVCPYCLGEWIAAAFTAGLLVAPRATRWIASVFVALTGSDVLQLAYARIEHDDSLGFGARADSE
jgi:hypothetical protein